MYVEKSLEHREKSTSERPRRHGPFLLAFLLVIAWAPLPLGSNRHWSLALLCAAVMFLSGVLSVGYVVSPFGVPPAMRRSVVSLGLLILWAFFPLVQLLPAPTELPGITGGDVAAAYQGLAVFDANVTTYLSIDRDATLRGFLEQSAFVSMFILVLILIDRPSRLRLLLTVMLAVGAAEAFYGLLVHMGGANLELWSPGHTTAAVTGTYVNQNHFAGFMELTLPIGLGLAFMAIPPDGAGPGLRARVRLVLESTLTWNSLILFAVFIMLSALILTASRGAIGALVFGIATALVLGYQGRVGSSATLRAGLVLAVMIICALSWFGTGTLGSKIGRVGMQSDRGDQRDISYELIRNNPVLGTGTNTYQWIFPRHKDLRFGSGYYEHAHNDFLELLGEQGVVGFSLLAVPVVLLLVRVARNYRKRRDGLMRGAMFASLAGCISLLAHGLVDFNMQIPANASYFFCLLALGIAAGEMQAPARDSQSIETTQGSHRHPVSVQLHPVEYARYPSPGPVPS